MRAVLGLLFLMGGFTVAYIVLSGKIPLNGGTNITPPSQSDLNGTANNPTAGTVKGSNAHSGGPMGMSLGPNSNDTVAATGGFY